MAWLPIDIPWTSKPPGGVPVNRKYPTCFLVALNEYSGKAVDAISGVKSTFNSGASWGADGIKLSGAQADRVVSFGTISYPFQGTYDFVSLVDFTADSLSSSPKIFSCWGISPGSGDVFLVSVSSTGELIIGQNTSVNGVQAKKTASGVITVGKRYVVACHHNSNSVGGSYNLWVNGVNVPCTTSVATGAAGGIASTISYPTQIGVTGEGNPFAGTVRLAALLTGPQPSDTLRALSLNPWLLFQPRIIPIPFGAGGGGTSVTVTHDLKTLISTSLATNHDLKTTIALSLVTVADLLATIGTTIAHNHDTKAAISSPWMATHDTKAIIATALTQLHDTLATITTLTGYVVNHDTRVAVSTALAGLHDLQSKVSSNYSTAHDTRSIISTTATVLADTLADISVLVGYIIQHDTRLVVTTEITRAVDTLARISRTLTTTHDTRAIISDLQSAALSLRVVADIINPLAVQASVSNPLGVSAIVTSPLAGSSTIQ